MSSPGTRLACHADDYSDEDGYPGEGADGGAPIQRTHSEKRSMFKRFFSRSDSVKKHDKKEKHHAEKELNRK